MYDKGTLVVENEERNNLDQTNKILNSEVVLILGGLNGGILLF